VVNHIPFLMRDGMLVGHVARANDVWKNLAGESVVIFQGPEAYITPSWYASKREHGKVVPTWNYAVVHAHGTPRAIEDRDWLYALVTELTDANEASRPQPWKVTDAPAEFVRAQLGAIVGIEIAVARLVGKWKASQNRSAADRRGVIEGLGGNPAAGLVPEG
jgi:transcriptional regulator